MAVLCGMPTIQYLAWSARLSVWLSGRVQRWQVGNIIWHKAHHRRRRIVQSFARWRQCVLPWRHLGEYDWTCASFGPLESTTDSALLHSSWQKLPLLYNRRHQNCPMIPWAHAGPQPKQHLNWFSRFCTDDCRVSLYFTVVRLYPLEIAPSHGGSGPPCDTWFLGPTRVLNTTTWALQLFLQGSLWQPNRQTNRPIGHAAGLVTIGHMYICSTAMRLYNA